MKELFHKISDSKFSFTRKHKKFLESVSRFISCKEYKIYEQSNPSLTLEASAELIDKCLRITFVGEIIDKKANLLLAKDQQEFTISEYYISSINTELDNVAKTRTITTQLDIHELGIISSNKSMFTKVFALSSSINIAWNYEQVHYKSDLFSSATSLEFQFEDETICAYLINFNKNPFLIIESYKIQTYEVFSKKAHAINLTLGYISGHLSGLHYYIFQKNSIDDDTGALRFRVTAPTIHSIYTPIQANPYGFSKNQSYLNNLPTIPGLSQSMYSKLCNNIFMNDGYKFSLLQIINAADTNLFVSTPMYCIALETLRSYYDRTDNAREGNNTINKKEFLQKIFKPIETIILSSEIADNQKSTLINKVRNISELPNRDKLKKIFERLGIELSGEDLQVLQARNLLLHGNVERIYNEKSLILNIKDLDKLIFYIHNHLYMLLSLLIMKEIGYEGPVLNWPYICISNREEANNIYRWK